MMRIIGICGYKRSGKDTAAAYLAEAYGYKHVKFSEDLKCMVRMLFDVTHDQVEGSSKDVVDEEWQVTPRQIMQFMGTEVMQYKLQELCPEVGRTFWVKRLFKKHGSAKLLVISDVRFRHEIDAIRKHDPLSLIVRIQKAATHAHAQDTHVSETDCDTLPVDVVLQNDDSVEALHARIDDMMRPVTQSKRK